jgi:hypothetical protein
MAVAALPAPDELVWPEPSPRARLRLLDPVPGRPVERLRRPPVGCDVAERRRRRASRRVRRNRLVLAAAALGLLVLLALPLQVTGGATAPGVRATPLSETLPGAPATVVVHPGDTLATVAARLDPAHPRTMAGRLAQELGTTVVVPGEHVGRP